MFTADLASEYPLIAGSLIHNQLDDYDPVWEYSQAALGYLAQKYGSLDDLAPIVEAFALVSVDFVRLQSRFMKTRQYARESSVDLFVDLYGGPNKMKGYYLDGLAMTYALWSITLEPYGSSLRSFSRV